jgi:ArsR family transcriptional regulator
MTPTGFFKCLGDPTRLRALLLLTGRAPLCVCDLQRALGESQPKVSRHLGELRACGLVATTRQGRWIYYALAPSLPSWAQDLLRTLKDEGVEGLADAEARLGTPLPCGDAA